MKPIDVGFEIKGTGMRLCADLGLGLLGRQWSVQLIERTHDRPIWERVAEIIDACDPVMEAHCDRISRLAGMTDSRGIANLIVARWIQDHHFVVVYDRSPRSRSLASMALDPAFQPPNQREFWPLAAMLFRSLTQLHSQGLHHGAFCPAVVSIDQCGLTVSDFGWGDLMAAQCRKSAPNTTSLSPLLEAARPFAAPEVLDGSPATRQSDLYSLGAVLYFLLTGGNAPPKHLVIEPVPVDTFRFDSSSEIGRFVQDLLQTEPERRLTRPAIEAQLHDKLLSQVNVCWPENWTYDIWDQLRVGLHHLVPNQIVDISDLYRFGNSFLLNLRYENAQEWFDLQGLLRSCGRTFLALSESPDLTERLEVTPMIAVCLVRDWQIRTITAVESISIHEDLREHIRRETGSDFEHAQFLLGPVREEIPRKRPFDGEIIGTSQLPGDESMNRHRHWLRQMSHPGRP